MFLTTENDYSGYVKNGYSLSGQSIIGFVTARTDYECWFHGVCTNLPASRE